MTFIYSLDRVCEKPWMRILSVLLLMIWSNSVANAQTLDRGLDVNDVTVLFPLGPGYSPTPEISFEGSSPIISPELFQSVLNTASTQFKIGAPQGVRNFSAPATWRVVGFRYDPCAPDDGHGSTGTDRCMQELRLIAQPMKLFQGPGDTAMHLLYTLGSGKPSARDPAVTELLSIKNKMSEVLRGEVSTAGQALSINPFLAAGVSINASEPMNQKARLAIELYRNYVRKFANPARLTQVTMMGVRAGNDTDWIFFGGLVINGKFTPTQIPNLAAGEKSIHFDRSFFRTKNTETKIEPIPLKSELSSTALFQIPSSEINTQASVNQTISQTLHRIENPNLTNRTNVDCLSCHLATGGRFSGVFEIAPYLKGFTAPLPPRVTAVAPDWILQSNPIQWNLRNMGYFNAQPSLSNRTVQESAVAAAELNQILGLQGPGRDCSRVEEAVIRCMTPSFSSTDPLQDVEKCLALCLD